MGKGDKKTKRGKITIGSTGVRRSRKSKGRKKRIAASRPEIKPAEVPVVVPVEPAPEVVPVTDHEEEKAPKKPAAKKPAVKKSAEPADTEETKQPKPKKKAAKPAEDLFTEPKESSE